MGVSLRPHMLIGGGALTPYKEISKWVFQIIQEECGSVIESTYGNVGASLSPCTAMRMTLGGCAKKKPAKKNLLTRLFF